MANISFYKVVCLVDHKTFVHRKTLVPTFSTSFRLQNNFCEFTTRIDKFKRLNYTQKYIFKQGSSRFLIYKSDSDLV